jgi:hypothetical protein
VEVLSIYRLRLHGEWEGRADMSTCTVSVSDAGAPFAFRRFYLKYLNFSSYYSITDINSLSQYLTVSSPHLREELPLICALEAASHLDHNAKATAMDSGIATTQNIHPNCEFRAKGPFMLKSVAKRDNGTTTHAIIVSCGTRCDSLTDCFPVSSFIQPATMSI